MLAERREAKRLREPARRRARTHAEFFFDLACPFTYLAAERVERSFDEVIWRPAATDDLRRSALVDDDLYATQVQSRGRAARRRAAPAARLARALPRSGARRDARCLARDRVRPRWRLRARRDTARVLRRLRPRRSRDPGRGGRRRGHRARRHAARGSATRSATARSPAPAARWSRRAPTACPRCASRTRCTGARGASVRRSSPRASRASPNECSAGHPDGVLTTSPASMPDVTGLRPTARRARRGSGR